MRILMAIADSSHSEETLKLGAQIAAKADEAPTLLLVIKQAADHPLAEEALSRARCLLASVVPQVRTTVRMGHPAAEIVREAEEGSYDLAIVGEGPRRNSVARLLSGPTAVRVAEHAPCPVLIAKGRVSPIRRLLLCDSGAESPSVLSRFTVQLAGLLEGEEEVTVLHVMSQIGAGPGISGEQLRANAEELIRQRAPEGQLLEQDVRILEQPGLRPHPEVRHGLVVDEILVEARSGNYDLVVIGAYRGSGWRRILFDDLAHRIIVQLDRPVLVVR